MAIARYCTLGVVECAVHAEAPSVGTCAICEKPMCSRCAAYDVDGRVCCETCGLAEEDRGRAVGTALLASVGVGYLATLALGLLVFHARAFIGGIAAIAAIGIGRILQTVLRPPAVTRRT
jgi:hypothetical protein